MGVPWTITVCTANEATGRGAIAAGFADGLVVMADINSARESAVKELNDHAVALAATMASKILRREVGAGDQSRLVSESLAELSRSRN